MATWGAYLKSYVVKEAVATTQTEKSPEKPPEKIPEKIPIKPIVPLLDYDQPQRTIEPIFIQDEDKDGKSAQDAAPTVPTNPGRLAKIFGYGASVEPKPDVVAKPNTPGMPKMATIVQQAQQAEQTRKALDSPQLAANTVVQSGQSNASRVAKMFGNATPTRLEPEGKRDTILKEVLNKVAESEKPGTNPGPSRVAKLFGYKTPSEPAIEQNPEKRPEDMTPDSQKSTDASELRRSQSSASRVAVFKPPEVTAPKAVAQTAQKPASNPWEALEQAEREWTMLTSSKPALKVEVPRKNSQTTMSEIISAPSSTTHSSRDPFSPLSSTTSSSRSIFNPTTEVVVPDYVLRAEEAERKRKALEIEQRAEKILIEQQQMDMELERMRMEEEKMREEAERIAQEEFEMKEYIQEVGILNAAVIDKAIQSPLANRDYEDQVRPTRDSNLKSQGAMSENSTEFQSPTEKIPEQYVENEKPLGRTKSRAKERFDRLNAEAEAERLKEEENRLAALDNSASGYASDYVSIYDSSVDGDDDDDNDGIESYREEAEKARRLQEERMAEEERLGREEEAERQGEAKEEARRIEEQRIAEKKRLRIEAEERLRLEEEEARWIEESRKEAEREEKERQDRVEEEEQRERARRAQEEAEEAERIENERLAQKLREEREREREDEAAREEAERIEYQNRAQQQREEAQRLEMERQRSEYEEEEEVEEPAETKEDEMRKAEERIRKAFAGLAAERGQATPGAFPATTSKMPDSPYRANIGGIEEPDTERPSPLPVPNRSIGGNLNRSATTSAKEGTSMVGGGNLVRAATTGGTLDRDNATDSQIVRPRPVIRGGLPGGPKVGLPSGGPRGGGLPMNPRPRQI